MLLTGPRTALTAAAVGASIGATLLAAPARACEPTTTVAVPQPSHAQMVASGLGRLPVAPRSKRVDLVAPPFSSPTNVTNPLFPISRLASVVLNGKVDGKPFRTETTLLPDTRVIEWSTGQCVETLVSQYVAYLDGRIQEVALDFYAQADDGSVWYFGEDVYNYERGAIADTSGTWLAGKEGPAAMIMPAMPRPGDVNRPENIPGLVWEEVRTVRTGRTVRGPRGPVAGAVVGRELHDDGHFSDKVFAPGYGEFFTADGGDVEALAVAVPTDAAGPAPARLRRIPIGANRVLRGIRARRWRRAARTVRAIRRAWSAHRTDEVPPRLVAPTARALRTLGRALAARKPRRARRAALDLGQAGLDLELRHRPVHMIDKARFVLWTRRVALDARARRRGATNGDVAVLEWIRDRFASSLPPVRLTRLDTRLEALRAHVSDGEMRQAIRTAAALRKLL
jgi:hypothetical protein